MVVKEYENAQAYLNDYEADLLEHEAVSQLILYNAYQNKSAPASEKCMFGVILDDDKPLLHYCNVAPHNMAIYAGNIGKDMIGPASALLADYMVGNHIPFAGLNAKQEICLAFIEQYKKSVNCTFVEKLGMDIMELREVNEIKPVEGKHRLASPEEVKLVTDWMISFQLEALANEINYENALEKATKLIEENKLHVYEDAEQKIVTMAAATRKLVHGIGIHYIYTPEEYRGKGYAAANIYYMSKELLEQGNEFCSLFVDRKNPISTRAYEKVGYHILEDNYEYKLLLT